MVPQYYEILHESVIVIKAHVATISLGDAVRKQFREVHTISM